VKINPKPAQHKSGAICK